jgi:hypothetical protein
VNNISINDEINKMPTNQNIKNDQKIMDKNNNNTSIYDTSFNMLYNHFDYNKLFLLKPKKLNLLKGKDKEASNIMKNTKNFQEKQLKKENDLKNQIINNKKIKNKIKKDKYINDSHKNYLNKLFKKKKVKSRKKNGKKKKKIQEIKNNIKNKSNIKTNIKSNNKNKRKNKKCNCKCWLNTIRNIIIFIIISSTLTFYSFVFFVNK